MASVTIGLAEATSNAVRYMRASNYVGARAHLLRSMIQTYAPDGLYAPAVDLLQEACAGAGDWRGAVTCAWLKRDVDGARRLDTRLPPQDRARTVLLLAKLKGGDQRELFVQASNLFLEAGQVARAAVCLEWAQRWTEAAKLWSRLVQWFQKQQQVDLYTSALVQFNLSRCFNASGKERLAHDSAVRAVYFLEEAADRYEQAGRRERAFDCYQVLVSLGKDTGVIEHSLAGYVNFIRILREDGLTKYALRALADAMEYLSNHDELAAAATLAHELVSYARSNDMTSIANWALIEQARLASAYSNSLVSAGRSVEMAENALLSAAQCYAEVAQYGRVGQVFVQLAGLPIEQARREHYARASRRYQEATNHRLNLQSPASKNSSSDAGPPVWHVDVIEWEQQGDAAEAAADILLEFYNWSEVTLRRALLVRLAALDAQAASNDPKQLSGAIRQLSESLGSTELYAMLSPLERLAESQDPAVRSSVMRQLGHFLYKRTIPTLRNGMQDPISSVREAARESLAEMRFPHAFEPLLRIFREEQEPGARQAALRALVMIDSDEVVDFLVDMLQHPSTAQLRDFEVVFKLGIGNAFTRAMTQQLSSFPPKVRKLVSQSGGRDR